MIHNMIHKFTLSVLALSAMLSGAATAHDPAARNGGRIVHAGNLHVELVAKGKSVEVFLLGHDDKPLKTDGYKGLAILVIGGKSERIALSPTQDNRLTGEASVELPASPKGVVQITSPAGTASSARFQ